MKIDIADEINSIVSDLFNETTPLQVYGINEEKIDEIESQNPQMAKQYPWLFKQKVA